MICLSVAHQSREESVSDLSFSESLSKNAFLEFPRTAIVLFLSFLNLDQCAGKFSFGLFISSFTFPDVLF